MKQNIKQKNIQIQTFVMIVLVLVLLIVGLLLFNGLTNSREITNFKTEASIIGRTAKNAYKAFEKEGLDAINSSEDGTNTMCITISGLETNGFVDEDLNEWDGYVIVEEKDEKITTVLWLTNDIYLVEDIDLTELENADLDKGIKKFDNQKILKNVTDSYEDRRGNKYDKGCINKKIEQKKVEPVGE